MRACVCVILYKKATSVPPFNNVLFYDLLLVFSFLYFYHSISADPTFGLIR